MKNSEIYQKIQKVLDKHNVKVELVAYKEHIALDGYYMNGKLKVNGKNAIEFTDQGDGGGCNYVILNEKYAKPLIDIQNEIKIEKTKIKMSEIEFDMNFDLTTIFYQLAEEVLFVKDMQRKSLKNHCIILNLNDEKFFMYKKKFNLIDCINLIKKNKKVKEVFYWDRTLKKYASSEEY